GGTGRSGTDDVTTWGKSSWRLRTITIYRDIKGTHPRMSTGNCGTRGVQAVEFAQQRAHRLPHVPDAGTSSRERSRRARTRLSRGVRDRPQPQPTDDSPIRPLPQ